MFDVNWTLGIHGGCDTFETVEAAERFARGLHSSPLVEVSDVATDEVVSLWVRGEPVPLVRDLLAALK